MAEKRVKLTHEEANRRIREAMKGTKAPPKPVLAGVLSQLSKIHKG